MPCIGMRRRTGKRWTPVQRKTAVEKLKEKYKLGKIKIVNKGGAVFFQGWTQDKEDVERAGYCDSCVLKDVLLSADFQLKQKIMQDLKAQNLQEVKA